MLSRAVSRFATISTRQYAAAAAKASGAEELLFTLASPDQVCLDFFFSVTSLFQAIYTNAVVKQVDVPTLAGVVGVLASHVPTIGVLKPGVVQVTGTDGSWFRTFFFRSVCERWRERVLTSPHTYHLKFTRFLSRKIFCLPGSEKKPYYVLNYAAK